MKNFWNACKRRSVILWALLVLWFLACSLLCYMLMDEYRTPLALLVYAPMAIPICHLYLYEKPWNICSVVQVIRFYLALAGFVCSAFWSNIPQWCVWAFAVLCVLNAFLFFGLEEKWLPYRGEREERKKK